MYFAIKTLLSALVIAGVTQISERTTVGAALLKSLPLTSLLVFLFMKYEGRTNKEISSMSWDIFWLVIPSLVLFVVFPILLDPGLSFKASLMMSTAVMVGAYAVTLKLMA